MNIGKLKRSTQIAIMTGAGSGAVEKTASGTAPLTLSDSVAGNILSIIINGRSEVSAESIVSVGEGWSTVDLGTLEWVLPTGQTNIFVANIINAKYTEGKSYYALCSDYSCNITNSWNQISDKDFCIGYFIRQTNIPAIAIKDTDYTDATAFKTALSGVLLCYPLADPTQGNAIAVKTDDGTGIDGTMATITTGLPLRSTLDGTVYDELTSTKVITRCEVVNNEVVPLAEPVEIPLSSAEIAALTALKTYDPSTVISVTDNPSITVKYMGKNITRTAPKKRSSRKKKA